MALREFVDGSGELQFADTFLSPRVIREALAKRFRLVVLEETPHQLRCKLVRYGRLYGAPVLWPHPTLHALIRRAGPQSTLSWHFHWPDYYMLFLLPVPVLLMATSTRVLDVALILTGILWFAAFFLVLTFLDTKWVAWRVRRSFEALDGKAPPPARPGLP
jgi:hypothetical protein